MTRNRWVKKCFHTPHSTWLKNSRSHFEPDATQTFSCLVSDCVTTILSRSSFSPPLHCQWSSSAAVWLLTIKLRISALFLMLGHYHKCNNVPTHAGIFFHFRVMARSPSSVTSQGAGLYIMYDDHTVDSMATRHIKQPPRFCVVLHHQLTTNTELAQQECNCFFKSFWSTFSRNRFFVTTTIM